MSITTETNRLVFVGDGNDNSPYAISFPLRDDDSVEVIYITDSTGVEVAKTRTTDYTIALAADFVTATLTLETAAPATGETMLIRRSEPATRLSNYKNFDGQPAATTNSDYDKGTMQDQTLQEQLDRAILVSKGHPNVSLPLTPLILKGNAGQSIIVNPGETDWELAPGGIPDGTIAPVKLLPGTVDNQIIQYNDSLGEWEYRVILTVNSDTDGTTILGRTKIHNAFTDWMSVSHFDHASDTNFALSQGDLGETVLNSASGQLLELAINGVSLVSMSGVALTIGAPLDLIVASGGDLTVVDGILTVNSDADGTTILGRMKIGTTDLDKAAMSHFDFFDSTTAAIQQNNAGSTSLSAPAGQTIQFGIVGGNGATISGGLFTIDSDSDLVLTAGDLTVTSGTLTVNSDADGTNILGRWKIGTTDIDKAGMSHFDFFDSTTAAIQQNNTGSTTLSAPAGQTIQFGIVGGNGMTISGGLVTVDSDSDLVLTAGDATLTAGNLIITAGDLEVTAGFFSTIGGGEITISVGIVVATGSYHLIDTESDAASDDLVTITGGVEGRHLFVQAASATRTVVLKHATGNLRLSGGVDISLVDRSRIVHLYFVAGNWVQVL